MENYINQVLEDLRLAYLGAFENAQVNFVSDSGDDVLLESVSQYVNGPRTPLSLIVGIEKVFLPPAELLLERQASVLCREMIRLLAAYNFFPVFPENLPDKSKYRLLLEIWDSPQVFVKTGTVHLEFCEYDPDVCPFPNGFCRCR
ncbi:MAG: hypothetical protein LAT76_09065 [Schleiferiaceae bacterium]|nr:hypothetical protein [Schleiferiaceae bacterium]